MWLTSVISSAIEQGFRKVKAVLTGKSNVQTGYECSPYGIDSCPVKTTKVIYSYTDNNSEKVALGYVLNNKIAEPGETIVYGTDADGAKTSVLFFTGGEIKFSVATSVSILGDDDNAVRYAALNTGLQNLVTAINAQTALIQTGILGVGGAYPRSPVSLNISAAKITEIKTT